MDREGRGFQVRVRCGGGSRIRIALPFEDRSEADARAKYLRDLAALLVRGGRADVAERFLSTAAHAPATELEAIVDRANQLVAGTARVARPAQRVVTFEELALAWTSGELHHRHPDHVQAKKTSTDDTSRLKRINKVVGSVPLANFTVEHGNAAMRALPPNFSAATRRHYAQIVSFVLRLAVHPCGLIQASPLPPGWLPKLRLDRAHARAILYPEEDRQLLACPRVPLSRRVLYGFLTREGCRLSEATSFHWTDLDLVRGIVTLDENKTSDPRMWAMGADVTEALRRYRSTTQADKPFDGHDDTRMASILRDDLMAAGISRPALFERSDTRLPFRLHDLRGTFITLALATGKSETWVCDRTGHKSSAMLNRYRRQARAADEVGLGWFHAMHECIPELA